MGGSLYQPMEVFGQAEHLGFECSWCRHSGIPCLICSYHFGGFLKWSPKPSISRLVSDDFWGVPPHVFWNLRNHQRALKMTRGPCLVLSDSLQKHQAPPVHLFMALCLPHSKWPNMLATSCNPMCQQGLFQEVGTHMVVWRVDPCHSRRSKKIG